MTSPRPTQLGLQTADIHEITAAGREQPDLFKLYRREWLIVYTSTAVGAEGVEECRARFAEKYEGRVRDQDKGITTAAMLPSTDPMTVPARLELLLWNVKGEYKWHAEAEAASLDGDKIVVRNSKAEFELKDYGKKKLLSTNTKVDNGSAG